MKILLLAELVIAMKELRYSLNNTFTVDKDDRTKSTPSNKEYRFFNDTVGTSLYFIGYEELITFQDFSVPLNSTLRDDYKFTIQTRYGLIRDIVRESSEELYKARNSFPLLPSSQLSDDDLESMEFQLLTQYTQNEVNSKILYHVYCNSCNSVYSNDLNDTHPRVQVDFRVYDILSEDDLEHLIQMVRGFLCKTVQSS